MFPRFPRRAALSLTALLLVSACAAVGPDPTDLPDTKVPASFAEGEGAAPAQITTTAFWSNYQDRILSQLIAEGLGNSLDILAANERIRAAEADLRATAPLAAQVTGEAASASRTRTGGDNQTTGYSSNVNLSAGFVFDLFGGARRAREGAAAAY
ncbi:MAG: TolC family protein, partial [Paracoccus sp. (in: a-proteobacteria)]|nr:TolC family protein [Paracoccus sp. (in: a-proteobacteria)]